MSMSPSELAWSRTVDGIGSSQSWSKSDICSISGVCAARMSSARCCTSGLRSLPMVRSTIFRAWAWCWIISVAKVTSAELNSSPEVEVRTESSLVSAQPASTRARPSETTVKIRVMRIRFSYGFGHERVGRLDDAYSSRSAPEDRKLTQQRRRTQPAPWTRSPVEAQPRRQRDRAGTTLESRQQHQPESGEHDQTKDQGAVTVRRERVGRERVGRGRLLRRGARSTCRRRQEVVTDVRTHSLDLVTGTVVIDGAPGDELVRSPHE